MNRKTKIIIIGISFAVLVLKRLKKPERLSVRSIGEVVSPRSIVPIIINISLAAKKVPFFKPSNVPDKNPNLNITSPGVKKKWNKIVRVNNIRNGVNPFTNLKGDNFEKKRGNKIKIASNPYEMKDSPKRTVIINIKVNISFVLGSSE